MRPTDHTRTGAIGAMFALALAGSLGCVGNRPSSSKPCPCATGNVCCASGVCAADGERCVQATLALASENAGTWSGYFENYKFTSGSDALEISLDVSGSAVSGTVVIGAGPPPPAPTDPFAVWPPPPDGSLGAGGAGPKPDYANRGVIEGVAYQARDITWENLRLKFRVALADAWQPLCDLYAAHPITVGQTTFVCPEVGWGWSIESGCTVGDTHIGDADCNRLLAVCQVGGTCQCGATTCTPLVGDLNFDVALHDDRGDGSTAGTLPTNIRLMRTGGK